MILSEAEIQTSPQIQTSPKSYSDMLPALKAYWKQCATARAKMEVIQTKVAYGGHPRQYSIVVQPGNPADRVPGRIAFYFHGGGWTFGRPETFTPAAIPWLDHGFTVVLPSYRRPPSVGLNRIVDDCRAAVHHFVSEVPQDERTTVNLGGISAGAHLAAVLATEPDRWLRAGWSAVPSKVLLCGGPLSLGLLRPARLFLPRYDHLDAVQRLTPEVVAYPVDWLLLHGTVDPVVHPGHSEAFVRRLREFGAKPTLHRIEGGRHLDSGRWMFGGVAADVVRGFLSPD